MSSAWSFANRATSGALRWRKPTGQAPGQFPLSFTDYTYWPNGLRKAKSGSLAARFEYRYTYY